MDVPSLTQNGSVEQPFIWPFEDPPIYEPFWFEKFDAAGCLSWMERNWAISAYICATYLILIYVGKRVMERKPPFELHGPLVLWNLSFALFYIAALIRGMPEMIHVLLGPNGFHRSVCVRDSHTEAAAFWGWAFTLSKVVELGDTAFVILRKKPLLFIHYFHHGVSLITCWYFYPQYVPIFRWFGLSNCIVHAVLYSYLFLKTIHVRMPQALSTIIVFLEVLQMVVVVAVNSYAIWMKVNDEPCAHTTKAILIQMSGALSFVVLFTYLFKPSPSLKSSTESTKTSKQKTN